MREEEPAATLLMQQFPEIIFIILVLFVIPLFSSEAHKLGYNRMLINRTKPFHKLFSRIL